MLNFKHTHTHTRTHAHTCMHTYYTALFMQVIFGRPNCKLIARQSFEIK